MRTAAIALACLLAATATGVAGEPPLLPGAPPFPPPSMSNKLNGAPAEVRAYAPEQLQLQRARDGGRPPHGRVCFSQAETRDKIVAHRLADPLRALRLGRSEGEALSAKLCRWKPDEFVYEIHVLRRDGRVLRVYMNAQSGESLNGQNGLGQSGLGQSGFSQSVLDKDRK